MKTIRLLYPDHASGGLETYYFGAKLLSHILPENPKQPLVEVKITPPDGRAPVVTNGIAELDQVQAGIRNAKAVIAREAPDRIVTIGGNCIVSLAAFDYLHGLNPNTGIVWIDSHPDVSLPENGYPNAHAMVLGALLGRGAEALKAEMENPPFGAKDLLYVGLQGLLDYQRRFLEDAGVDFMLQNEAFVGSEKIADFVRRYDRILVHLDIDVLDPKCFHSTYFANPALTGDGSGGGRMTMDELARILGVIAANGTVSGFTIAEYLPFDEERLHKLFAGLQILTD